MITPRVSVVVPAFNEPVDVLRESLNSLRQQTMQDFECLVVDESTEAESVQACAELCDQDSRFRHLRPTTRLGLAGSLNLGIKLARAPLIARFDSDDICQPDRLALQVDYLGRHPQTGVVGGALQIISSDGRLIATRQYPTSHAEIEEAFVFTNGLAHPTVLMRRSVLPDDPYDASFRYAEDLDLWLRLLNRGVKFANLPQVVVRYRQDSTVRQAAHWQFNLLARKRNISPRYWGRKSLGIFALTVWAHLPPAIQESVFKRLLLRRG